MDEDGTGGPASGPATAAGMDDATDDAFIHAWLARIDARIDAASTPEELAACDEELARAEAAIPGRASESAAKGRALRLRMRLFVTQLMMPSRRGRL